MERPRYPVGIQTFEKIREGNYVYVDKTEYIYRLATGSGYYFLSRPRRFGKSLLLSTIDSLFRGRRDLFKGLYIDDKDWEWVEHPVFHFALNGENYNSVERLYEILASYLVRFERQYNLPERPAGMSPSVRFANDIIDAVEQTGRKVVILIDEYDQPLLQNIEEGKENMHTEMRAELQGFYSVMKAQDRYIRFAMLSGISKFSKVSVFSGLNNLNDISLDVKYNAICGISEAELYRDFRYGVKELAEMEGMTEDEIMARLKKEFDGYHFARAGEDIYNPFSLLNTFEKDEFRHYWAASGTPSFLISLLKSRQWDLKEIGGSTCSEDDLMGADRYLTNPIPMLYQSGYLTIKRYDKEYQEYHLDYPNEEVSEGFASDVLKKYSGNEKADSVIKLFVKDVRAGNAEAFMETLKSFMADVPYEQILNKELHYENMMYLIMKLMGFFVHTEYHTSDGRIDMVVKTAKYIYVMEFKLHGSAEEAMAQIVEKEYYLPFVKERKQIILIGATFNPERRRLDDCLIKKA